MLCPPLTPAPIVTDWVARHRDLRNFALHVARKTADNSRRRLGVIAQNSRKGFAHLKNLVLRQHAERLNCIGIELRLTVILQPGQKFRKTRRERKTHINIFILSQKRRGLNRRRGIHRDRFSDLRIFILGEIE